mmetsp:Transcript_10154/g.21156  ORF Transcript_10154/g.21156 Transcript_10154/m.21156 type:complete len:103 (-) Transcript_10154:959-1267(-)
MTSVTSSSNAALRLYRALFREAAKMPVDFRRDFIRKRVRSEFEKSRLETDPEQVAFLIQLGEVQLENISIQAAHLTELAAMDMTDIKGVKNTVTGGACRKFQ